MDDDSDWSDIDESESDMEISDGEENEHLALPGSTDGIEDSDEDSIPPTTSQLPGPSQLREMRKNYVWHTANRQVQNTTFTGSQGIYKSSCCS